MSASDTPLLPFTVSDLGSDTKLRFEPQFILPRSQLPFSAIQPKQTVSPPLSNKFFRSSLIGLGDGQVLVSKVKDSEHVAVERVGERVFSITEITPWALSRASRNDVVSSTNEFFSQRQNTSETWWKSAVIPARSCASSSNTQIKRTPKTEPLLPLETLRTLGEQYLEALYISKTSLAFFVKGPLSRARAQATTSNDAVAASRELVEYLRSLILSHNQMEKKYTVKLSEAVRESMEHDLLGEGNDDPKRKAVRQKRTKRINPGKDGLFPRECEYVLRWLCNRDAADDLNALHANVDTLLKSQLPQLRFREQLIQLVVILEILSIEEKFPADLAPTPVAQSKKGKDLPSMLEMLADRLCIWQSLYSSTNSMNTKDETQQATPDDDGTAEGDKVLSNDHLKDFGIEVLVPFYTARLPETVDTLTLKFGVKTSAAPLKRKASATHALASPGTTQQSRRQAPAKSRKLARTSSGTSHASNAPVPSLSRSTTDSFLEDLVKRERSETPQPHLASKMDRRPFSRSSSISQSRSFSQREVDFSMINKFKEQKTQKKARIDEEIKSAISALRKPNRSLVSKEYYDGVQVNATPRRSRSLKGQVQHTASVGNIGERLSEIAASPSINRLAVSATPAKKRHSAPTELLMESPETQRVASTPAYSRKLFSTPGNQLAIADTPIKSNRKSLPVERKF